MSHFYIVKNLWKPHRKPANLPHFRLSAPIGQNFTRISIDFFQYKNGSKFFYDLLSPIPTYTEGPQIFKKFYTFSRKKSSALDRSDNNKRLGIFFFHLGRNFSVMSMLKVEATTYTHHSLWPFNVLFFYQKKTLMID